MSYFFSLSSGTSKAKYKAFRKQKGDKLKRIVTGANNYKVSGFLYTTVQLLTGANN